MKKYTLAIIPLLAILLFMSCDGFMDIHKDYIKDGEIIYAPKPDTISFNSGNGRLLFKCRTYNATNVETINVYWNDHLDSLIIPVELKTGYDSISVILDNMIEKSYTFNVRTTDIFGHKSLYATDFGVSYGEIYISSLSNRRIKSINVIEGITKVEWYSSMKGMVETEIKYLNAENKEVVTKVLAEDYEVELENALPNSPIEYRSMYKPDKFSIDTLATDWSKDERQ